MRTLFPFVPLLFLFACQPTPDPDPQPQPDNSIRFTGLTLRDDNGQLTGAVDNDDWGYQDSWEQRELDLFTQQWDANCSPDTNFVIQAYPNPCTDAFFLLLDQPDDSWLNLRLVDEQLRILASFDSLTVDNLAINTDLLNIKDTIRLYYKFIRQGCEFRGHGDLLIQ